MDRRSILIGAASLLGAASLGLAEARASVRKPDKIEQRTGIYEDFSGEHNVGVAFWSREAWASPHREVVRAWIKKTIREGVLYCHGDGWIADRTVRLVDTRFDVKAGGKVWNHVVGYTDEIGLEITITEMVDGKPAVFAPIGLASTFGAGIKLKPEFTDVYYVRKPLLRYEEDRELRFALGDDRDGYFSKTTRIGFDSRWMDDLGWTKNGVVV